MKKKILFLTVPLRMNTGETEDDVCVVASRLLEDEAAAMNRHPHPDDPLEEDEEALRQQMEMEEEAGASGHSHLSL